MTLNQFQQYLHALYQGDSNTPESGDDDFTYRTSLLVSSIHDWDNEPGIFWAELWKMNSTAQTQTTNGVATTFTASTDFRFPGGFVRLVNSSGNSTFYKVKRAQEIELLRNQTEEVCWFTGNEKDGFTLNFLSAPATGLTVDYPYYKKPYEPSTGSHVIEMADPWFALYTALAKLHEQDGEGDRALLALQKANSRMANMRIRNELPVWFQENSIPDRNFSTGSGGFGG